MFGSFAGNVGGALYFAVYQACGLLVAFRLFNKEKTEVKILIGSVLGNITLMWFPVICAFFANFTTGAHIGGLIIEILLTASILYFVKGDTETIQAGTGKNNKNKNSKNKKSAPVKKTHVNYLKEYPVLYLAVPLFIYFVILLWNHTLLPQADGGISTGQATFGDMNMHLGFVTSIARQQTFPPVYSIFPDAKLSYPFLSDTISSSIYIWGGTLRFAFILPMLFAVIHVFAGMYAVALSFLKNKWKAFLAFALFFLNGGFGFIYFLSGKYTLHQLMNDFYVTPANLITEGVRWTNIIVDMLLPQRATLFGWSVLFTTIFIIYKARTLNNKKYFITAAFMAGSIPMIHTHSFLALGIICFGWLIMDLTKTYTAFNNSFTKDKTGLLAKLGIGFAITAGFVIMTILTILKKNNKINTSLCFYVAVGAILLLGCFMLYLIIKNIGDKEKKRIFTLWMIFLGIVLVLALPQLFTWTFSQVESAGSTGVKMLRGYFNWGNDGDTIIAPYVIFYFKNLGIMGILILPALIFSGRKNLSFIFPAIIIWFIAQFVLFQPNPYDNNKLLLVVYMFMCIIVSDMLVNLSGRIPKAAMYPLLSLILVVASLSGIMSMAREVYSGMPGHSIGIYSKEELDAAKFIEDNLPEDATFLTDTSNNNLVAAITGRNIVCGSSSYLYFHGFSTFEREEDIRMMYSNPLESEELLEKYNVDFIYVSNSEYYNYEDLNEEAIYKRYRCIYSSDQIRIYQVTE